MIHITAKTLHDFIRNSPVNRKKQPAPLQVVFFALALRSEATPGVRPPPDHRGQSPNCKARSGLQLRTGGDERLAGGVGLVLVEVLDEAAGEVLCLLIPHLGIGIGVARIEDAGIDALELRRDFEVEIRDLLGRGLGVWIAMFVDWADRAIWYTVRFVRGKWAEQRVL